MHKKDRTTEEQPKSQSIWITPTEWESYYQLAMLTGHRFRAVWVRKTLREAYEQQRQAIAVLGTKLKPLPESDHR